MDYWCNTDVDVRIGARCSYKNVRLVAERLGIFPSQLCFKKVQIMQCSHGRCGGLGTVVDTFYTIPQLSNYNDPYLAANIINPCWDASCLNKYDVTTYKVNRSLIIVPSDAGDEIDEVLFIPNCKILTVATKESIKYLFNFKTMPDGSYAYLIKVKKMI